MLNTAAYNSLSKFRDSRPENLPVAILVNGAAIWNESDIKDWNLVVYTPRKNREEQIRAEREAMVANISVEEPVVIYEGFNRGRVRGYGYRYSYKEYSDGTFEAVVTDKNKNVLFPISGSVNNISEVIMSAVDEWLDCGE